MTQRQPTVFYKKIFGGWMGGRITRPIMNPRLEREARRVCDLRVNCLGSRAFGVAFDIGGRCVRRLGGLRVRALEGVSWWMGD